MSASGRTSGLTLFIAGAVAAWLIVAWLDTALAPGAGGVWLATTILLGGIAVRLRQARQAASCATGPRLRPLQVSCFGAIAFGVHLLQHADAGALAAAFPLLAAPWLPPAFILGGVIGLAILSFGADCRDAAFSGASLEEREHGAS